MRRQILALTIFFTGTAASGQSVLTLEDAVQRALVQHPRLLAGSARVAIADGLIQQAALRPNPRLYIQSENWNTGSPAQPIASTFTDQFLYASQLLETGGKRERRVELARAGQKVLAQDREVLAREIAARVKWAYWAAAGAENVVKLLERNQRNLQQNVEYHEIQVREGAIAEADLIRVRLEERRGAVSLESAMREANAARLTVSREMGEPNFSDFRLEESFEGLPPPPDFDITQAIDSRPDIDRTRRLVAQADANLRVQEAVARPDIEVLGGYKRTVGFNTAMWGVQIALPFSNKNQGNISAAISEIRAAEADLAALRTQARAEILAAQQDVQARRERLAAPMRESLAVAAESVAIVRAAYREGGTDLLRLLDAERMSIELEVMNARLQMEYRQALVGLETALGLNP